MNRIYVYSSTGNSLALAEGMARRLGDCELVNMARCLERDEEASGETVGLVFPVHAFGPPAVVRRFFDRLSVDGGSWVYLLLDSAGMPLGAPALAAKILAGRSVAVRAGFHVAMAGNYPPLYNPPSGEKRQALAERGEGALDAIAESVIGRRGVAVPGRHLRFLSEFLNAKAFEKTAEGDRRFFVDDGCDGCGLCAELCPAGDIVIEAGRPRWRHRCTGCFTCFHWCPHEAIQYNRSSSAGRNRYRHPSISPERYRRWCRS